VAGHSYTEIREIVVTGEEAGTRLDRLVAMRCPELSRSRVQELIDQGLILRDGKAAKGSQRVRGDDVIRVEARPRPPMHAEAEAIPLDVLYEDDDVIAVNKPAGMTVHAGAGNHTGTLVNALLGRGQSLSQGGDPLRPGIVHRLDKQTSGILLVAKNDYAHAKLAESFRQRTISKVYVALVQGLIKTDTGRIELPIVRDAVRRTRMTTKRAVLLPNSRPARTDWRVLARIDSTSLLEVKLHTGRTHQIRVHFSALRHPVVGDTLYGASGQLHVGRTALAALRRNFLHAAKIGFTQPRTGEAINLTAPLPEELRDYLARLAAVCGDSPARIDGALKGFL
jgi:23S rRNA pseudouridine1911/1915/1917 synthase